jgi:hypothetical protein
MPMQTSTKEHRRISTLIVRAWFDTAVNPLIRGLNTEASLLAEGNLTWRFQSQELVSLVPVQLLVESNDNLDQFLTIYPECATLVRDHDKAHQKLSEGCRVLQTKLVQSTAMRTMFERATSPGQLPDGTDIEGVFGAFEAGDYLEIVAEYIINDIQRLPSYFTTAIFWNMHSQEFLGLRESDEVRPFWRKVVEASESFSKAITQLTSALRQIRNDLSFSVGVPIEDQAFR